MKAYILTLGCKVNQYESQAMLEELCRSGFAPAETEEEADVVILNSCTVTAASDQKMRKLLHRARRKNPQALLVLTGCMPQAFPEEAAKLPEPDLVLGTSNRKELVPSVLKALENRRREVKIRPYTGKDSFESLQIHSFQERTRAFLKIQDGCNRFCSYCIMPYSRGRVRSKPLEELTREARTLAASGYREIVLTGINLSCYGQDSGLGLWDAVEAVCGLPEVERVRLGSLEPEQMELPVLERLARQEKLCPQFHLSLQSGCDATLKRMNRHYTAAEYESIVNNIRGVFDNPSVTTDMMVGFAGETPEDFEESLNFARKIGFAKVHVFAYSRRPGTAADRMPGQVPNKVKEERSRRLIEATNEARRRFLLTQVGRTEPVLFESKRLEDYYEGYTANYTPVHVQSPIPLFGKILPVKILEAGEDFCFGSLI